MALSIRFVCLHRNFSYILVKPKHAVSLPLKSTFRHLRGSRLGRELDKTEAKFQQLLKSLKETSQKSILKTSEIPDSAKSGTEKESHISSKGKTVVKEEYQTTLYTNDIPCDSVHARLEGKITPLKKLSYAKQLERKYNKSLSLLRMFGGKLCSLKLPITLGSDKLPCPVELMLPSPQIEAYRNQDEFSIGMGIDGNPKTVGYILDNLSGDQKMLYVGPEELTIIKSNHKEFIKDVQNYIRQSPLPASMKYDDEGYWKSVSVRSNTKGDLMGAVTMYPQLLQKAEIETEMQSFQEYFKTIEKGYELKSLFFQACSSTRTNDALSPPQLLLGEPFITEELNGMKFQISPESFFLVNTKAMEVLVDTLKSFCRVNESTTVIDIFSGTGPISLSFAPHVKKCIGIEPHSQSISDAKNNAIINNLHNVEFMHGNPDHCLRELFNQDYHSDMIAIVSPSRTELSKVAVRTLRECKYLKKIIFITTKPRSTVETFIKLCRPAGSETYLGKYFVPLLALPIDLFPQTEHYALAVMFQRL